MNPDIGNEMNEDDLIETEKVLIGAAINDRIQFLTTVFSNVPIEDTKYRETILSEIICLYDICARYLISIYQ